MCKVFLFGAFLFCVTATQFERDVSNRITNGNVASENQFPYVISLQQTGAALSLPTRGHSCGGVLITLQHALTTASCLYNNVNGSVTIINHNEYRVFTGSSLLTNDTSTDRIRAIANFTVHPEYLGPPAFINDIAIITIVSPFGSTVAQPLALPSSTFEPSDFSLCTVTGWGGTSANESASTVLRYAYKYVYNLNVCTSLYNPIPGSVNILPTMVCAASYDIISSGCTNDIGNPLVCNNTLTGLLFMSDSCRSSSYPEIYTRVSNYSQWIRTVSSAPTAFSSGAILLVMTAMLTLLLN